MKVYEDIKQLTLEEVEKLSSEEKYERYIELSPQDKYRVRLTDLPKSMTISFICCIIHFRWFIC